MHRRAGKHKTSERGKLQTQRDLSVATQLHPRWSMNAPVSVLWGLTHSAQQPMLCATVG